jgi:hypothetical protein
VEISVNNDLYVFSEAGSVAKLQKKDANGIVITVVPEPASLALLMLGCLILGVRFRES